MLHTFRLSALVCEKKITHPPHAVVVVVVVVAFVVVALVYFSVKLKYAFFMGSMRFFAALSHNTRAADPATQRCSLPRLSPSLSLALSLCWPAAPFTVCLLIVITFVGHTGFKLHLCLPIGLSRCCLAFHITHTSCYPSRATLSASQWDFRFRNLIKEYRDCVRELRLSLPVANELKQWKQQQRN